MRRSLLVLLALLAAAGGVWWFGSGRDGPEDVGRDGRGAGAETRPAPPVLRSPGGKAGDPEPDLPPSVDELGRDAHGYVHVHDRIWRDPVTLHVVSARDGGAIGDALVRVRVKYPGHHRDAREPLVREARTDGAGMARLPRCGVAATWIVRKPGFRAVCLEWSDGKDRRTVELPPARPLAVVVRNAATGSAIGGVRVRARWVEDRYVWADVEQTTDASGRFEVAGVPTGAMVELAFVRDGYGTVVRRVGARTAGEGPIESVLGEGADVAGTVRDLESLGVGGAEVFVVERGAPSPLRKPQWNVELHEFRRTRATTDGQGRYLVRGVPSPAEIVVYARAPDGSEGRSDPLALPRPGRRHETDVIVSALGSIEVAFEDSDTGESLSSNYVRCSLDVPWTDARDDQKARDDPDTPLALLRDVAAGPHEIHVDSGDFLTPAPVPVEVRTGEVTRVRVTLDPGLEVTGRVVDVEGRPLDVHVVFAATWRGVPQVQVTTTTHGEGRFTLRGIPPVAGELRVIDDRGESTSWQDVEIAGDLGDLVFAPGPRLVGRLPPDFRTTSIRCGVLLVTGGGRSSGLGADEQGRFQIAGIEAGVPTNVYLRPAGGAALVLRGLVLEPGEVRDLGQVEFPPPQAVEGRVVDADGRPVRDALVRTAQWWCDDRTRTDEDGRFRLERLPPGPSTLWIEREPDPPAFHPVEVTKGMDALTVRLARPGTLRLRIVRSSGEPLANVPVNVFPRFDTGVPDWNRRVIERTDSRGVLELSLSPGFYGVLPHSAARVELVSPEPRIRMGSGDTVELELEVR